MCLVKCNCALYSTFVWCAMPYFLPAVIIVQLLYCGRQEVGNSMPDYLYIDNSKFQIRISSASIDFLWVYKVG